MWQMCEKWYDYMQPGWCQPVIEEFMENECEALPGVAYLGVWYNRSTINTKTGYDDDDDQTQWLKVIIWIYTDGVSDWINTASYRDGASDRIYTARR